MVNGNGARVLPDRWLAAGAVALAGVGAAGLAGGVASSSIPLLVLGAVVGGAGLAVLLVAGWLDALLLVALSIPLPALYSSDEVRIAAAAPVAAMVVGAWALGLGAPSRAIRWGAVPRRALAVLAACVLVAGLFADARIVAARELLNMGVLAALLIAATDLLQGHPERRARLVRALAAVAAVTGGLAVLETVGVLPGQFPRWGTPFHRAALGFGQPNALGLFLALSVPLVAYKLVAARGWAARSGWAVALGTTVLGLAGTFSRGAWLAVLIGAGALAIARAGRTALRVWGAAVATAVLLDLASGGALRDTALRTVGDWVVEQRAALLFAGVLMFLDHPLIGLGPGGFAVEVDRYAPLVPELWDVQATPHNAYVQMAAETGAFGLAAFLLFLAAVFLVLRRSALEEEDTQERSLQRALLWSFAVVAVAGFAVWPFSHGAGEAVVLVMALACAGRAAERARVRDAAAAPPSRREPLARGVP